MRKLPEYDRSKASISTWIFTITRNTVIDHYRRARPGEELDENMPDEGELDEDLLSTETLSELAAALRTLPEELQDIIVLRYYDGKPLTEIAGIMDLSYGAVKLRHQNALMLLKKKMKALAD
jgi:RNA polymerase sigma-70 factor (ECF subfamily)